MKKWFVWECEEGGGACFERYTAKGAVRAFRRTTIGRGRPDNTELDVCEATPEFFTELDAQEET